MGHKIKTSFREHIRSYKYEQKDSNFASHMFEEELIRKRKKKKERLYEIITLLYEDYTMKYIVK